MKQSKLENWIWRLNNCSQLKFCHCQSFPALKFILTLQSESVAANCPSNKAASLWLSEQQELLNKHCQNALIDSVLGIYLIEHYSHKKKIGANTNSVYGWGRKKEGALQYQGPELIIYLSNPITGCKAPARRTSFFMFGEEWTRFPITPTCVIQSNPLHVPDQRCAKTEVNIIAKPSIYN